MNKQNPSKPRLITPFLSVAIVVCTLCALGFIIILFTTFEGFMRMQMVSLAIVLITLVSGLIYFFAVSANSALGQLKHLLEHHSTIDTLTGLYTRHWFLRRYQEEIDRAIRYANNLAVIMVDIDHFSELNRTHGTATGDIALQTLAELLRTGCRNSDVIARYGGDSFVILIPEGDTAGTLALAEKLRNSVAAATIQLEEPAGKAVALQFTISLGMACMDNSLVTTSKQNQDLIAQADAALYRAKHVGRNRVMATQ